MGNIRHQNDERVYAAENIRQDRGIPEAKKADRMQFKPLPA